MKVLSKTAVAAAVCAMVASMAQAAVISWNLNDWGDSPTGAVSPGTGVEPVGYWNDTWLDGTPAPNPMNDLRDSTGAATTADVAWSSNSGTWNLGDEAHLGTDADGSLNREILYGYVNGLGAAGANVTFSEIPYALYDVYVYVSSDDASRIGTVTDGATTYSFGVLDGMITDASGNALFAQTTDTGLSHPEANYAVFSGLSGASQTFSTHFRLGDDSDDSYGGIAAVQIVQIPEPATIGLFGLAGAGVLFVRRRFMI